MAKLGFLFALFFVGGLAVPVIEDEGPGFDEDMAIFFDHTDSDVEGRIIGGTTAHEGAFPWMVALTNGANRSFLCGGSILNNRLVLTAAHCIHAVVTFGQLSRTLRFTVGTNRWNSGGQTVYASSHRVHPQYNGSTLKNDLGTLTTASAFIMTTRVRQIPISFNHIGANVACRVSGWGGTRTGGPISTNLQQIQLRTIDGNTCRNEVARVSNILNIWVPAVDPNLELCTFVGTNRGTCNGDSGSALVNNANNQQIGIVSWGLPCARGAPDMFVRVSAYRSWLGM